MPIEITHQHSMSKLLWNVTMDSLPENEPFLYSKLQQPSAATVQGCSRGFTRGSETLWPMPPVP